MRHIPLGEHVTADLLNPIGQAPTGIVLWHRNPATGRACGCRVPLVKGKMELVSEDPLTLRGLIVCRFCGLRGWISRGKWETKP